MMRDLVAGQYLAQELLGTLVYSTDSSVNLGTLVNGKWMIKNQQHISGIKIRSDFSKAIRAVGIRSR